MSKLVILNALFGEKFAINPDHVRCVDVVTDEGRAFLVQKKGHDDWNNINAIVSTDENRVYVTETFDEVVSKINAAQDH
jgi:hypothetical protein